MCRHGKNTACISSLQQTLQRTGSISSFELFDGKYSRLNSFRLVT